MLRLMLPGDSHLHHMQGNRKSSALVIEMKTSAESVPVILKGQGLMPGSTARAAAAVAATSGVSTLGFEMITSVESYISLCCFFYWCKKSCAYHCISVLSMCGWASSMMAQWFSWASQGHELFGHDPGVIGLNPGQVELGVCLSWSVSIECVCLCWIWTKKKWLYRKIAFVVLDIGVVNKMFTFLSFCHPPTDVFLRFILF